MNDMERINEAIGEIRGYITELVGENNELHEVATLVIRRIKNLPDDIRDEVRDGILFIGIRHTAECDSEHATFDDDNEPF